MEYIFLNQKYKLISNVKEAFEYEPIQEKITDYYEKYDYIVGDWAYGKVRLKGFTNKNNPIANQINNFENIAEYIEKNCAYGCRYFVLEKIKD